MVFFSLQLNGCWRFAICGRGVRRDLSRSLRGFGRHYAWCGDLDRCDVRDEWVSGRIGWAHPWLERACRGLCNRWARGSDYDQMALKLIELPEVIAVTPQIEGQVMASRGRVSLGAVIRGVRWSDLCGSQTAVGSLDEATVKRFRDGGGVLIGRDMAVKMGVAPGDKLTLTTARGKATAFGTVPTRRVSGGWHF